MLIMALISCALFIPESRSEQSSLELSAKNTTVGVSVKVEDVTVWDVHLAAAAGDVAKVLSLVHQESDLYATDINGLTPMHHAVLNRRSNVIFALLDKKFDLNRVFETRGTVLEFAIKTAFDMARFIMAVGGNINEIFHPTGETYIHKAVAGGDFVWTKKLIHLGADLEVADWSNNTALRIAVARNNPAMLNLLAAAGAKTEKGNLLHLAVEKKSADCLRRLLGRGVDVDSKDEDGNTPIAVALKNDDLAMAEILLKFRADLDQKTNGKTLLDIAVEKKSYTFLRWLMEKRSKIDDVSFPVVEAAIDRDDVDALKVFIPFVANNANQNPDETRNSGALLKAAIKKRSYKSLRLLLEEGLKADADNSLPMEAAIDEDDVESLKILKEFGANVNYKDPYRGGLVHYAAVHGSDNSIRWLADQGVNIDGRNYFKKTPLHLAVMNNRFSAVRALVELGACVDSSDTWWGDTPLDIANERGYTHISSFLRKQIGL